MSEKLFCKVCGSEFEQKGRALTCSKSCSKNLKLIGAKERLRLAQIRAGNKAGNENQVCGFDQISPSALIHNFIRELNAYNVAHPYAPLSYGKYSQIKKHKS